MNYHGAINEQPETSSPEYHPHIYTHPNVAETKYDLQEITLESGKMAYVVSESPDNQGPGFESQGTRDIVAHRAAQSALALNDPERFPDIVHKMMAHELDLYQQRPDGDFDRVVFREISRDGRSNGEVEREQAAEPELYPSSTKDQAAADQARTPQITESGRDTYTREQVEAQVESPLRAPEETHQQWQANQEEAWRNLTGPAIDRSTEVAPDQASHG